MKTATATDTIKTILLVDDDEDECMFFTEALPPSFSHIKLICCNNSLELEAKLVAQPSLVFLDINMPGRNGFECLKIIRNTGGLERLPVIMFSHSYQPPDVQRAYDTGATLFVNKPQTIEKIEACLQKVFSMDWSNPAQITAQYKDRALKI